MACSTAATRLATMSTHTSVARLPLRAGARAACRSPAAAGRRCLSVRAGDEGANQGTTEAAQEQQPEATLEHQAEAAATAAAAAQPAPELVYTEPSGGAKAWTSWKLLWALPWRRFKSGSVLTLKLSGSVAEQPQGRFSPTQSLPALCSCLRKAAVDPRVQGVVVKIDPLALGWGKLQELRRHVEHFRESGKFAIAYLERAGEKEYYLASAFGEVYAPPSASLSLRGMSVSGTFLRGALDKAGVEPEVRRIGKYKSAGDQLLRADMSDAQREQLQALLDDMYDLFTDAVATARGKAREEVEAFVNEGVYDMEAFKEAGYVDGLMYECELEALLKERTGVEEGKELRKVGYKKYSKVSPSAFGIDSAGKKAVAIVRTSGAITGGSGGTGSSITAGDVIGQLRGLKKNKSIAAIVLRIDSPGGDALASDLMWREIQEIGKEKPVIASMADVAASGGYYMAMAGSKIVAERGTITGSIGVVTGKFNLSELYEKIGYNKQTISRGKYAQLFAENKAFSEEEGALFDAAAQHAYESFRDKAASSRGMSVEAMQEVAQGRVWSGKRAIELGLIDALGGVNRALQLAKEAAGLEADERVRVLEVSRGKTSPLAVLSGGGASLGMLLLQALATGSPAQGAASLSTAAGAPLLLQSMLAAAGGGGMAASVGAASTPAAGQVLAAMPDVTVEGVASAALLSASSAGASSGLSFLGGSASAGGLFDDE